MKFKERAISSIMAGAYIALGAIVYLMIPNSIVGSLFFATGIFLVINFCTRLYTRVIPVFATGIEFDLSDIIISFIGNGIGGALVAYLIKFTRIVPKIQEHLQSVVDAKINDNFLSLVVMGIFCAIFVGYAVLAGMKYKSDSFAKIFYVWLFVTGFVFCGFDHVVANMFYFALYGFIFGFKLSMVTATIAVLIGNTIGGLVVGYLERKYLPQYQEKFKLTSNKNSSISI